MNREVFVPEPIGLFGSFSLASGLVNDMRAGSMKEIKRYAAPYMITSKQELGSPVVVVNTLEALESSDGFFVYTT
jgi:hypothetical protein